MLNILVSRFLSRIDVPQQLDIYSNALEQADQVYFDSKGEYVQALKDIASTQSMMHTSDIESLGNLFEGNDAVYLALFVAGTLFLAAYLIISLRTDFE